MDTYKIALFSHIAAGSVALITFWSAALLKKGSPRHRRSGQVYLLAMLTVILSGVPLVHFALDRGQLIGALFLGYLLVLVSSSCWSAWRAIRDRQQRARYYGPVYWTLIACTALGGAGVAWLGAIHGVTILVIFGGVGLLVGFGALRTWRSGGSDPKWWLKEHYGAMIGNGVATHIAFFGIGLRNALPAIDPQMLQLAAWTLPLAGSVIATIWLNRKYGGVTRSARSVQIHTARG